MHIFFCIPGIGWLFQERMNKDIPTVATLIEKNDTILMHGIGHINFLLLQHVY